MVFLSLWKNFYFTRFNIWCFADHRTPLLVGKAGIFTCKVAFLKLFLPFLAKMRKKVVDLSGFFGYNTLA